MSHVSYKKNLHYNLNVYTVLLLLIFLRVEFGQKKHEPYQWYYHLSEKITTAKLQLIGLSVENHSIVILNRLLKKGQDWSWQTVNIK